MVDKDGVLTPVFIRGFADLLNRVTEALNLQGQLTGNIFPTSLIVGRVAIGTILQYLDDNGIVLGPGIDFARAYVNKDTDHIADGTGSPLAGGKVAYSALVATSPTADDMPVFTGAVWALTQKTHTKAPASSKWLDSYDSATGDFTNSQPAFSNVSGVATTAQIGTGTPGAGKYVDGGTGAWTVLPGAFNFADNETVAGAGTAWTLAHSPSPAASLQLYSYVAGFGAVLLIQGADYTLAGNAITTGAAYAALYAFYRW